MILQTATPLPREDELSDKEKYATDPAIAENVAEILGDVQPPNMTSHQ